MSRSRPILGLVLALGLWGCGGGGGGGGGPDAGPVHWGVPIVASSSADVMNLTFHNLRSTPATVTIATYEYDGSAAGGGSFTLDGFVSANLPFAVPSAASLAWFLVTTPDRAVEVSFAQTDAGGPVDEASRAFPLGDLAAPPPTTTATVAVPLASTGLRVTNATGAPINVAATGYTSPTPGSDGVVDALFNVPLAGFETVLIPAGDFGAFRGQLQFSAPSPFFVAVVDETNDLAFDGVPPVARRDRILHTDVAFGLDHALPNGYDDFALILTNTSASARQVELRQVRRADGTAVKLSPRTIAVGAHESRVVATTDAPLADLFGDAMLASALLRARLELFVPEDVDVSVRRFDPVAFAHHGTTRPQPSGHVVDALGVLTDELLDPRARQWVTIHNPNPVGITVNVGVIVPQPDGFDAAPTPVATLTVPANGFVEFSPDGVVYLDRDGSAVEDVALRCTSANAFAMTGRRETRAVNGVLTRWSPLVTRSHDDAN